MENKLFNKGTIISGAVRCPFSSNGELHYTLEDFELFQFSFDDMIELNNYIQAGFYAFIQEKLDS